jgi:hypothetical protein
MILSSDTHHSQCTPFTASSVESANIATFHKSNGQPMVSANNQIVNGIRFRFLTILDEHTRQCVAVHAAWSIRAVGVHGPPNSHCPIRSARTPAQRQTVRADRLRHQGLAGAGFTHDDLHHPRQSLGTKQSEMASRRQLERQGKVDAKRAY